MSKPFIFIFIIAFIFSSYFSFSQVGIGEWRTHVPYLNGGDIVLAGNDLYMSTKINLLKYSILSGEVEPISKISGLNDSDIRSINYHNDLKSLLVGYANGNIDIIAENNIVNVSDIKRKSLNTGKAINSILFIENNAYLACEFGIVVLNISKKEIKETWFIGKNSSYLNVNELITDGENIYAATDKGVYKGNLNTPLVDFSKWEIISDNTFGDSSFDWMSSDSDNSVFNAISLFQDKVVVNFKNSNSSDTLLVYDGNSWSRIDNIRPSKTNSMSTNSEILIVSTDNGVVFLDKDFNQSYGALSYYNHYSNSNWQSYRAHPSNTIITKDNNLWIADKEIGLVNCILGETSVQIITVGGPESYDIYYLTANAKNVYGVAGGRSLSWSPNYYRGQIYRFNNETWTTKSRNNSAEIDVNQDFIRIITDPKDPNRYFCASWQKGIFEYRNNEFYKQYNVDNSTLSPIISSPGEVRVGGLAIDTRGNLWATTSLSEAPVHVMNTGGEWNKFNFPAISGANINVGDILITQNGNKWVTTKSDGILVFNDSGTLSDQSDDKSRKLSVINEDGELISNTIFSIAEDHDGYIWVGTDKGVAIYYNPGEVFNSNIYARQIKLPKEDNPKEADIFLGNETVTMILVDGANKKWFGTQSGGVYYTSYDGQEEYLHFMEDNSPLLDNSIVCGAIAPQTGEVFFGTAKGIISYRNVATEGNENYTGVYAFPNPVYPDYNGIITITGLVAETYVKITDVAGNMVYETRSDGGQAAWDGKDLNGNRVHTGIYLVFLTNDDGSKTNVTKIMFIN